MCLCSAPTPWAIPARRIALAGGGAGKRGFEFLAEHGEIAFDAVLAPDQHVVCPGNALQWQDFPGERAQAALHAIAGDGIADALGDGDTEAQRAIGARERVDQKHETGPCDPGSVVRGEEIGALRNDADSAPRRIIDRGDGRFGDQAESFLRPRARRARMTLRPPGVAIRVRKPWRRARTRLLGWKVRFIGQLFSFESVGWGDTTRAPKSEAGRYARKPFQSSIAAQQQIGPGSLQAKKGPIVADRALKSLGEDA